MKPFSLGAQNNDRNPVIDELITKAVSEPLVNQSQLPIFLALNPCVQSIPDELITKAVSEPYLRLKRAVYQGFEYIIGWISCLTRNVKVMSQNGFPELCVRETVFDSSIHAHWTGDYMSQSWRSYGFSDRTATW